MKQRKYLACYDDGHDYGEFNYYSYYRANSRKNLEDAYAEYRRKYGRKPVKITSVFLEEEE